MSSTASIVITSIGIIAAALAGSRHIDRLADSEYKYERSVMFRPNKFDYPIYSPLRLRPVEPVMGLDVSAECDSVLPMFMIAALVATLFRLR